jgi:hypothetical protein
VFNANLGSISAILWHEQILCYINLDTYKFIRNKTYLLYVQIKENFQRIKMIRGSHILVSHLLSASQIHAV